ncbi:5-hydroxytryptamine receptor 3C-like [Nelusetta ayraudi]|uniref:5-hydroxytryptamine receptor 3C-like n=1 Tax=Nelusetta ayraudi TaxID=303726 RepID=UPI003F70913D
MFCSMDENTAPEVPYVYLYHTGRVHDAKPLRVVSSCNLDIYTFPFDIQDCTLTFNSYLHEGKTLQGASVDNPAGVRARFGIRATARFFKLTNEEEGGRAEDIKIFLSKSAAAITHDSKKLMTTMGEWELLDITSHKQILGFNNGQKVDELIFHIRVRRRATLYVVNLLIPSCFLITVDLFSFLLPPLTVDRSSFKMTLILGYTVFLLIMNDLLPITGNTIPLINVFFSLCLALMVASLLETIFITNLLSSSGEFSPAPRWIRVLVLQFLGCLVCMPLKKKQTEGSAPCSPAMLNCTRPDSPALLEALRPVFNLSSIRPGWFPFQDEKAQLLSLFIWQHLEWNNEFVRWNPEQCGTSRISVPKKLLWVPDIVINEFMQENVVPAVPYSYLYADGLVVDKQPMRVVSSCELSVYIFPFDIQNCTLSFNSYSLRAKALQMGEKISAEAIFQHSKQVMTSMGEWELNGVTSEKMVLPASDGELYDELRYFVSFRRHSTVYVVNLLLPSGFLITVDLFSFLLPAKSPMRSYLKMTLILGYTLFLLNTNDMLPGSADTLPLINIFLSLCLGLMMGSLLETILITNLCSSAHLSPVPRWIRVLVLQILGCLVGLRPEPIDVMKGPVVEAQSNISAVEANNRKAPQQTGTLDGSNILLELKSLRQVLRDLQPEVKARRTSDEWIQVSRVIDRLLFSVYILFISTSFITIALLWANTSKTA